MNEVKQIEYDEIRAEATGRVGAGAFCARVYRREPNRLEFAYGETVGLSLGNLMNAPQVLDLSEVVEWLNERG